MLEPNPRRRPIDRISLSGLNALPEVIRRGRPCIVEGALEDWLPRRLLDPRYFQEHFPDLVFSVSRDLPKDRTPLHDKSAAHVAQMPIRDFIDLIYSGQAPCYLSRVRVSKFPGMDKVVDFERLLPDQIGKRWSFLWIGSKDTNSGLHFDMEDTLLVQLHGEKMVTLVSPESSRYVPIFSDNVFSSPIETEKPDLGHYPGFGKAELFEGKLCPGDMIFIPQPWWHSLRSLDPSVSVSYVFGKEVSMAYLLRLVTLGGVGAWWETAKGFLLHGLFGKSFVARIYSPPPTGRFLFELVRDGVKRRLQKRPRQV